MKGIVWMVSGLLLLSLPAFAGTKEGEPEKEMLRMMELLREWEMLKNFDLVRDLESAQRAGEPSVEKGAQKSQQKVTKEKQK